MAVYENNILFQHKDQNGNMNIDYPITRADNVDGLYENANLTGVPTAPTAESGTNTTQVATTEFVQTELADIKKELGDGMTLVADAITEKGVETATDATLEVMAANIRAIDRGVDTSDATALASMIAFGQTAWVNGSKITGTLGTLTTVKGTKLAKATSPSSLSEGRFDLASANAGTTYTLFAGGSNGGSVVDAYNISLTRSTLTSLSVDRENLAGASVGDYALFAGGYNNLNLDAYNTSLTRSTLTSLSVDRAYLAGASVGDYALFAGGFNQSNYYTSQATVDAYNARLARTTLASLNTARYSLASATVGSYVLFAGGTNANPRGATYFNVVDAYNTSLTRSTLTSLSVERACLAGASVGDYALFAGGYTPSTYHSTVDAYNTSLTRSTPTVLSVERGYLAGASVGDYALFAGGKSSSTYHSTVDAYNDSLTRSILTSLSDSRKGLCGASIGDYALFAGGYSPSTYHSTVDAYALEDLPVVKIPETTIYL